MIAASVHIFDLMLLVHLAMHVAAHQFKKNNLEFWKRNLYLRLMYIFVFDHVSLTVLSFAHT